MSQLYSDDHTVLHFNYAGIKDLSDSDFDGDHFKETQYLYLKRNLLQALPRSIGQLTSLRELHLEGNSLHYLPDEIGDLKHLQVLNVVSNNLTHLPVLIGSLGALKKLQISNNHLRYLPDELGHLEQLETLEASGNLLTSLPITLVSCSNLKLLALDKNRLRVFPRQLCGLKKLTELSLAGNSSLEYLPPMIFEGLSALSLLVIDQNPSLTALPYLQGQCTVSQYGQSGRRVVKSDRFKYLDIGDQQVALPEEIEEYCEPDKSCVPCLQELSLRTIHWNLDLDILSHILPRDLTDRLQCPICRCIHCQKPMFKSAFPVVYRELTRNFLTLAFCCSVSCLANGDFSNTLLFPHR